MRVDYETKMRSAYFDFLLWRGEKMVSAEKISEKLIQLDEYMNILSEMSETPAEIFLKDKILLGGAKYYLQVSIK